MRDLSRRERQIMEIIFRQGRATIKDIYDQLEDPPTDSALRATLRILHKKGHVRVSGRGKANVYAPRRSPQRAAREAVAGILRTFFAGSREHALDAILSVGDTKLTEEELKQLSDRIEAARAELAE